MNMQHFIIFEAVLPNPAPIAGAVFAPYGSVAAPLEPAARPAYFDGKLLTAHDLADEQASVSDTGFDLI
jgi:hypothetical protein